MKYETTKEIGYYGERVAANYLRRRFYFIIAKNYYARHREIDLIAKKGKDIVFVEVKTRSYAPDRPEKAPPKEAVHAEKQRLTRDAAMQYMLSHPCNKQPRMDVIEVYLQKNPKGKRPKVLSVRHLVAAY